jgi:outer membrane lipoprotein carrier protein
MPGVNRRRSARVFVILISTLASGSGWCEDSPALTALVRRVQAFYRDSGGIVANFTQTLESRTFQSPQEETGTVYLKAPGKMRWEYARPRGKLAVCDGKKVYLYLPEDRQVLVGTLQDLDAGALVTRLLLGETSLFSQFKVEEEPKTEGRETTSLRLVPRAADFPYESLTVEVSRDRGAIHRIAMLDPLGNRMEYRFDDIRVQKSLSEKLFNYQIPRGVEIQTFGAGREAGTPSP